MKLSTEEKNSKTRVIIFMEDKLSWVWKDMYIEKECGKKDEGRKWLKSSSFSCLSVEGREGKKQAVALSNSCVYCCCNTCWFL